MRRNLLSVLSVLAAGLLHALAMTPPPHWGNMRVKHAWNAVPENWVGLGHPPVGTIIDLHIALKSQNENALIDALYEVSSPGNPMYGAHLSKEQVAELVAPHTDTLELVNSWLEHNDVSSSMVSITHGGSWLTVSGVYVSKANELLGASYQLYRHTAANTTVLRTISYGLPAELHGHVETVVPTTYFGSPHTPSQTPHIRNVSAAATQKKETPGEFVTTLSSRVVSVTPLLLRELYKTKGYVPAAADRNALGVAGFLGQYPNPDDLGKFMKEFRTDADDATYLIALVDGGGYNPNNPGLEGNQNIQYTAAITYPTLLIYYSTGFTLPVRDPFSNFLKDLLKQQSIPQTISISYGANEHGMPTELAVSTCYLFAQLGARGISVLVASGDDGVGSGNCRDRSGNVRFRPIFPATCPWVTAVGGTTSYKPEVAAEFSGGGFSNYFPRPEYQDEAIVPFLRNLGNQYHGLYTSLGRGIPDISAQAFNFEVVRNMQFTHWSGTSCSAPTVAGIISLLNDYLISKGEDPLGFLNPWLYSKGFAGLNDITSGSNPGCNTNGFSATTGWDPVTGLGTPDFNKLKEIRYPTRKSDTPRPSDSPNF
ncbi:subtilisin-like protein [Lactarius psammicola]|nr:subtilisin-like protein [Lactarius psammicola]